MLVILLIILQALDGWTTYKAITDRLGQESNPVFRAVIDRLGLVPAILVTKAVIIVFLLAGVRYGWWNGPGVVMLIGLCLLYGYVVIKNLRVLVK